MANPATGLWDAARKVRISHWGRLVVSDPLASTYAEVGRLSTQRKEARAGRRSRCGYCGSWARYFSYGTCMPAHRAIDHHVEKRVWRFLTQRHKVPSHGTR
jgi:hypothetical protein